MARTSFTRRGGVVRLTVSAKVANDLGLLQGALKNLADRLGHTACATGCDIFHIGQEVEFGVNEVALNPQPLPPRALSFSPARGTITVTMPERVNNNIDLLNRAVGNVLGKLGCEACCSGFDILFRNEINTIALDDKAGVARFGGAA
jgi:hypothetical protein